MTSSELLHELRKLNATGSVLYVAAHPDDENTALLTYLAQEALMDTAYLSLTRGGGGQNLIGSELKEGLGLIRANELLQARKIDGAKQLFTRARDFGYSKNPEDTLENWQEEKVLGDVVYAVRFFKPDVIITRFDPIARRTHGHHTVSAQLAVRAFEMAADPKQFPEQLKTVGTHQAKRILWNGYSWNRGGLDKETRPISPIDIGKYNPYLGSSYTEVAARSRSMHKSQGFGRAGKRGEQREQLVFLGGAPVEDGDLLSGVERGWERYEGGAEIGRVLRAAIADFDPAAPWKSVESLTRVDGLFDRIEKTRETVAKREALHRVISEAMGLYFEARAPQAFLTPGEETKFEIEFTNRSPVTAALKGVTAALFVSKHWPEYRLLERSGKLDRALEENVAEYVEMRVEIPADAPLTQPYWLEEDASTGIYHFENERLLELHQMPMPLRVTVEVEVNGRIIQLEVPGIRNVSDPVKGEVHEIVSIRPKLVLESDAPVLLFANGEEKTIKLSLESNVGTFSGRLVAEAPEGWKLELGETEIDLSEKAPQGTFEAVVTPPAGGSEGVVSFSALDERGERYALASRQIEYEHIGRQPMYGRAETTLVRLDLARAGDRIACIEGVGDTVPATLERIGYTVERIEVEEIDRDRLKQYDTVILGPRVFDAVSGLDRKFDELSAYVEAGGTLISQYNTTSFRTKSKFSSPYPIELSRERVSEEKAEMRILMPEHSVFNFPNTITDADFEDWIQERGLYFASSWDERYTALLSSNDRGEPGREGGLLVAQHGKGWYAYTGLSFFRQLPEGNAGAIRLFVNLISLGHGN